MGWVSYGMTVLMFAFIIFVHEAGHYIGARRSGISVAEFAVGLGPQLGAIDRNGTHWSLRALPLGGYVRWHEEGTGAFGLAAPWRRAVALVGGPLANGLLTYILLMVLFFPSKGLGAPLWALRGLVYWIGAWFFAFGQLFSGAGASGLTWPIGVAQVTATAVTEGWAAAIQFAAFLSLNIGLFNLLPLPGLDGGRLLFLAFEKVRRRPIAPHVEGGLHAAGFLLIMCFMIATAVKDLLT